MKSAILKYVLGVSVSCAFAISYSNPSKAFPVLTDTVAVKSSTPSLITDARYYGRGYGGGRYYGYGRGYGGAAAAGIIGGIAAGAIPCPAAMRYARRCDATHERGTLPQIVELMNATGTSADFRSLTPRDSATRSQ